MIASTKRGRKSRKKILETAAGLFYRGNVSSTSIEDVLQASDTGKSQFYHYFDSKEDLVREVIREQTSYAERIFELSQLDSWEGIEKWFRIVAGIMKENGCTGGCPLGSMAAELADTNPAVRAELEEALLRIRGHLEKGLAAMKKRKELKPEANPRALAIFAQAALQGGCLLCKTTKNVKDLEDACRHALAHLKSFAR